MRDWIWLAVAIAFELAGTSAMKLSGGFARLWPSVGMFVSYALAFICLSFALRSIQVGVAYAIWSGIGTALIAVIGVLAFQEGVSTAKVVGVSLIVGGVVALRLAVNSV